MSSNSISVDDRGDDGSAIANKNSNDNLDDLQIASNEELVLPPEVWASVMEYLPFDNLLSCGATCRTILHDAMPLITKLHIDKSSQLNLAVTSRFRDIKEIHINSLYNLELDDEGGTDVWIDMNTKIRLVPFLTRFVNLDRVMFWGRDEDGNYKSLADSYFFEGEEGYPNEGPRDSLKAFLDMISGAFDCNALRKDLMISGLVCPDASNSHGYRGNDCKTCVRACNSFPLQEVVEFECRGSSSSNAKSGRSHGLDVCLERAKLESIIESRPGARKLLRSKDRLLRLLGSGRRHEITSNDDERKLYFVKYQQEELDEIKRVIEYANLNVKRLDTTAVTTAIKSSFLGYGNILPFENQCILSNDSLQYLKDTIKLPIDNDVFERSLEDLMVHTQQIVWALNQSDDELNEGANGEVLTRYSYINLDCLKLLRRFSEVENNLPIQQISNIIHCLVPWLKNGVADDLKLEAAHTLKNVLTKGTDENRRTIIDATAIPKFSQMLHSPNDSIIKIGLLSLVEITTKGGYDDIVAIGKCNTIGKLIILLDSSKHDDCVQSSLQILVATKRYLSQQNDMSRSLLLNYLVHIMNNKATHQSRLRNCSVLLREIFEADNPPIQTVINLDLVPRLIEILSTTKDEAIRLNLEHVMINLLAGTNEQVELLVKNEGFLPLLVSLIKSQHDTFAEKTISALGKVAGMNNQHENILQAGIVEHLLQVLQAPNTATATLQVTASTLALCCRGGKLNNFSISKESLKVSTMLLTNNDLVNNDHETIVFSSCWTLYHILHHITYDEVKKVINVGFIKPLLKLLPDAPHHLQEPVLKFLHLVSTRGDECIKALSLRNGIPRLSKTLSNSYGMNQELATRTISNIISGNRERIQTAIDNNVVPSLVKMLEFVKDKEKPNEAALWTLYQMTKAGSASQVKSLVVEPGCLDQLCDLLPKDCNTVSLLILKKIVKVGKGPYQVLSFGVREVEKKLQELTDANLQLEQDAERAKFLKREKTWLEVDQQNKCVQSLKNDRRMLLLELGSNDQRSQCIGQKIGFAGAESPLGQVYIQLQTKEKEARQLLMAQLSSTRTELSLANTKLRQLNDKAEEIAPMRDRQERLTQSDMQTTMNEIDREIKELSMKTKEFKGVLDVDKMKRGIKKLFDTGTETSNSIKKSKKRKIGETFETGEESNVENEGTLTPEQRKERQKSIALHMTLLMHSSTCRSTKCPSANCAKMKGLLKHGANCKVKADGGCNVCKRVWALLQIHARQCQTENCPVPNCNVIRERYRQLGWQPVIRENSLRG